MGGCFFTLIQFQPELIIVSAGYDAALGCPEVSSSFIPFHSSFLYGPSNNLTDTEIKANQP